MNAYILTLMLIVPLIIGGVVVGTWVDAKHRESPEEAQAKFEVEHQQAVAASTARRQAYDVAHAGARSESTPVERTPGALPAPPSPPHRVVLDIHVTLRVE